MNDELFCKFATKTRFQFTVETACQAEFKLKCMQIRGNRPVVNERTTPCTYYIFYFHLFNLGLRQSYEVDPALAPIAQKCFGIALLCW